MTQQQQDTPQQEQPDAGRLAAADSLLRRAYTRAARSIEQLSPEQLAEVGRRHASQPEGGDYDHAAEHAADIAYATARAYNAGDEQVRDDRVADVPEDVSALEDLAGIAGGAALDLAYGILAHDQLTDDEWRELTTPWAGVMALPIMPDRQVTRPARGRATATAPRQRAPHTDAPARPTPRQRRTRAKWLRFRGTILGMTSLAMLFGALAVLAMRHSGGSLLLALASIVGLIGTVLTFVRAQRIQRGQYW